jgi:hypothetical protein
MATNIHDALYIGVDYFWDCRGKPCWIFRETYHKLYHFEDWGQPQEFLRDLFISYKDVNLG